MVKEPSIDADALEKEQLKYLDQSSNHKEENHQEVFILETL